MPSSNGEARILTFEFDSETGERRVSFAQRANGSLRVECGADLVRRAEEMGCDPADLMARYDDALPYVSDLFDRYRRILDRLDNPVYLDDARRSSHMRYLVQGRQVACEVFAKHDYAYGIDSLVAHGIAGANDLAAVIDRLAGNPKTVTAVARLLEQSRRLAGAGESDFSRYDL